MKYFILFFALTFSLISSYANKTVHGIVFVDKNKNQVFDAGDQALEGVFVSSLSEIVSTDKEGKFILPAGKKEIIFVIKPKDYEFPLQENNVPAFYKIVYQEPSPDDLDFKGIQSATSGSETLYFPMYKSAKKETYRAQMIGDIQAPTKTEVEFFQQTIVPLLYEYPADFKVCLGDIADNNLNIYPVIEGALNAIKTPLYMVFGNHDTNYRSTGIENEAETYRSHFGPDYYSFNYGKTHFVVLNTVLYKGWNAEENKRGSYNGGLHAKQLAWLKQDLELVPNNQQIVLMAHIPLAQGHTDSNHVAEVFDLLKDKEKILAIYGHLHTIGSWQHNAQFQWNHSGTFYGQIAGAACGSWWVGPYGLDSIPDATCADGAPPGIFLYDFTNNGYSKEFIAATNSKDKQLRISDPPANISIDSLENHFIYVNVFDGNDRTKVSVSIDNGPSITMQQTIEVDPFLIRNNYLRFNRGNWKPGLVKSTHLWKVAYPETITTGKHLIKATCLLEDGRSYSTVKVFELKK